MGADLLLTALIHDENTRLDWPAGREAIRKMPADDLMAAMVEVNGDECDTVAEARREANAIISELKRELSDKNLARDAYRWVVRGAVIEVRGGTSWGDDPSEGWTVFANAYQFPNALKAIGFEI